jgi:nucleoside-diphosphate-sugar epimerase
MIHVLITGAAGMIGRKLTQRLARDEKLAGREITALSLVDITQSEKPAGFGGRLSLTTLDVSDPAARATSGFFSNILREPLVGQEAVRPVSEDVRHWHANKAVGPTANGHGRLAGSSQLRLGQMHHDSK